MAHAQVPTLMTPVLAYHDVAPAGQLTHPYTISSDQFERQLAYLSEAGYRSASLKRYWERGRLSGDDRNGKAVILTIDDAQVSNYTVIFPLLQKYGMTAIFFIPTGYIGRDSQQVTMKQLAEMQTHGMEIYSHSHSHRFLTQLSIEELFDELVRSKNILEQHLGAMVELLACPGGRYNAAVLTAAQRAGYRGVCTSRPGLNVFPLGRAFYLFDRFLISGHTTHADFVRIVSAQRAALLKQQLTYHTKAAIKSLLGHRVYHAVWQRMSRA